MQFELLLKNIAGHFEQRKIDYALIGGVSLGFWGIQRSTMDLDFMIRRDQISEVDRFMNDLGLSRFYETGEVSQYFPAAAGIQIDFLLAHRSYALLMLESAVTKTVSDFSVRVLRPECLIGLKLQGAMCSEERWKSDFSDIEALMRCNSGLNWTEISEYFSVFDQKKLYEEFYQKYAL